VLRARLYNEEKTGSFKVVIFKLPPATAIEIPETYEGYVGENASLGVTYVPEYAVTEAITWTSNAPTVVAVNDGSLSFLAAGTATVTATSESGLTDTCIVTVKEHPAADVLTISDSTLHGYVGDTAWLDATLGPDDCIPEELTWTSSSGAIAKVEKYDDDEAIVYYLAPGTATITVSSKNGLSTTCAVKVKAPVDIALGEDKTVSITEAGDDACFVFTPSEDGEYYFTSTSSSNIDGTILDSTWQVLNTDYDSGEGDNFRAVYVMAAGETYYLRANFNDPQETGSFSVTVGKSPLATALTVYPAEVRAYPGEVFYVSCELQPKGAAVEEITFQSDKLTVATVDQYGKVICVAPGTATITATSTRGLTATCTLMVKALETISLGETKTAVVSIPRESACYLFTPTVTATYYFYSAVTGDEIDPYGYIYELQDDGSWSSITSNDDSGENRNFRIEQDLIGGTTYILKAKCYSNEATGSFPITLEKAAAATAIELPETVSGYVGETDYLDVTFLPDGSSTEEITWTSSNETALTIDPSGKMYFLANGTSVVTATTASGLSDTCTVTVSTRPTATAISTKESWEGYVGEESKQLPILYTPEEAEAQSISWESADPSIVKVSNGYLTGVAPGSTTVTATSASGLTTTCQVTIKPFETLAVGETKTATISTPETSACYVFTPATTGTYIFESLLEDESIDTYGYVYEINTDGSWSHLSGNDDSGSYRNFKVELTLKAGITYVLKAKCYKEDVTGSFPVCLKMPRPVGDLDNNGVVNMADAFALYRAVSGQITLTDEQKAYANMDGNDVINMSDAFALYRAVSGT
ncbi:MAG: Ig-like domain-containing protein, partial [Clostridia bacterium]|nr:Ig-like domain-containing protein [Clostridia bacterium]